MTERVDFYVLQGSAPQLRWICACRLAEKAYLRGMRVLVLAASAAEAQTLDTLLWSFSERSFVPHALCGEGGGADPAAPVQLAAAAPVQLAAAPPMQLAAAPPQNPPADLLINLSDRMPAQPHDFKRIAEIVDADALRRRLGRERYRSYRELQMALETHQLDATAET
ncbi:MAG TPA: DNA polymerase III subunit chi [Steroidobacteraceae bacterium]|nr:DNA polymerase III subunit chi [Steroidobacteraceae bacterium]